MGGARGSLAVLTSVVSSWSSQRVLELQEAERQPNLYASIDVTSRYGVVQFKVTNCGGGVARDMTIEWCKPLMKPERQTCAVFRSGRRG